MLGDPRHGEISKNDFVLAFHWPRERVDVGPSGIIEYHLPLCSLFLHTLAYINTHMDKSEGGCACYGYWVPSSDIIRGTREPMEFAIMFSASAHITRDYVARVSIYKVLCIFDSWEIPGVDSQELWKIKNHPGPRDGVFIFIHTSPIIP